MQKSKNWVPFGRVFKASYIKACYVKGLENNKINKGLLMFFAAVLLGLLACLFSHLCLIQGRAWMRAFRRFIMCWGRRTRSIRILRTIVSFCCIIRRWRWGKSFRRIFKWCGILGDGGDVVVVFAVMVFIVFGLDDVRTFSTNVTELITVKTLFCPLWVAELQYGHQGIQPAYNCEAQRLCKVM